MEGFNDVISCHFDNLGKKENFHENRVEVSSPTGGCGFFNNMAAVSLLCCTNTVTITSRESCL